MECPLCGSNHIVFSKRRGPEILLKYLFPAAPFQCRDCTIRFWKIYNPVQGKADKIAVGLLIIGASFSLILLFMLLKLDGDHSPGTQERKIIKKTIPKTYKIEYPRDPAETEIIQPVSTENKPAKPKPEPALTAGDKPTFSHVPATPAAKSPPSPAGPSPSTAAESRKQNQAPHLSQTGVPKPKTPAIISDASATKTKNSDQSPPSMVVKTLATGTPAVGKRASGSPEELLTPQSGTNHAKRLLLAVRTITLPDSLSLQILLDRPVDLFNSFTIQKPPKLVIDLYGQWKHPDKNIYPVSHPYADKIRLGLHAGYLRIVVDFRGSTPPLTTVQKSKSGISISIKPRQNTPQ